MNIYDYKARDGRKTAFMLIGLIVILTFTDFLGAAYVFDNPLLIFYGLIFRIFITKS